MATPYQDFLSNLTTQANLRSQQIQNTLNDYGVKEQERAFRPGSLEDLSRQVQTGQQKALLSTLGSQTEAAQSESRLQAKHKAQDELAAQLRESTDPQKTLESSPFYKPGIKYAPVTIAPGVVVPGYKLPGDNTAKILSYTDRTAYKDYAMKASIERIKKEGTGGPSERDKKIADMMINHPDLSRAEATDIVDGKKDVEINPNTGRIVVLDKVKGTAKEITVQGPETSKRPELTGKTLWQSKEDATGILSGVLSAWSTLAGNLGLPVAKETIQARQDFETATGLLLRSLVQNSKFPVGEVERLQDEVKLKPSILDSVPAMTERMKSINRSLRNRLVQMDRDANDTSLPEEIRSSQAINASSIRNFLDVMGMKKPTDNTYEGWSFEENK